MRNIHYRLNGDSAKEFGEDSVVYESEHIEIINDIENKISEALDDIKDIEGLEVIGNCKDKLKKLLGDLY